MAATALRSVELPSGEAIPVLGQGTWQMGERPDRRAAEIAALRLGLDLGLRLIDTAEMYGEGATESLVGEAIAGRRDEVFLVSKVYPHNAGRQAAVAACERSLRRLGTDRLDLYLLHWRGDVPLEETVAAFTRLVRDGKIRYWGVSNFDSADMADLDRAGGEAVATNQVLYNLTRRTIEWDLLAHCRTRGLPVMAYSPLEQGRLPNAAALRRIGDRHQATPEQVALAWVLQQPGVMAIPKAGRPDHVRQNRAAVELNLDADDLAALDGTFPPPRRAGPLPML